MKTIKIIPLELCIRYFDFDIFGNLYWKQTTNTKIKKHSIAGFFHKTQGYYQVQVNGECYLQHRILYQLYHNVTLSEFDEIDHHDKNPKNNSKENLWICDRSENTCNVRVRKDNKSTGIKNISIFKYKSGNKYRIKINKNHKTVFSEMYLVQDFTIDDMIKIRDEKLKDIHGEFASFG